MIPVKYKKAVARLKKMRFGDKLILSTVDDVHHYRWAARYVDFNIRSERYAERWKIWRDASIDQRVVARWKKIIDLFPCKSWEIKATTLQSMIDNEAATCHPATCKVQLTEYGKFILGV